MSTQTNLGGTFTFPGTELIVNRMGYGAMQLAGPHVFGPPKDIDAAHAVLREAIGTGINHIDTSDFYGPHVTNQIIKKALHPYKQDLTIVTKVGAKRGEKGEWFLDLDPAFLKTSVQDNLRNLGLEVLPIVNLRVGGVEKPDDSSIAKPLTALAELQQQGLIQHIGLSNISPKQFEEARPIAKIVCVQNFYNVAQRADDAFVDQLAKEGVAYVPFFPLGGFNPLQSTTLNDVASSLNTTAMAVALAWLLHRSPNILLIPGTSSVGHLRENIAAASLQLSAETLQTLDSIAAKS